MRQVLDSPFSTHELQEAWGIDVRKTTEAMRKFRKQYREFAAAFGTPGHAHNLWKAYRAWRRRMNLLKRYDRERFAEFTADLLVEQVRRRIQKRQG